MRNRKKTKRGHRNTAAILVGSLLQHALHWVQDNAAYMNVLIGPPRLLVNTVKQFSSHFVLQGPADLPFRSKCNTYCGH